MRTIRSLATLLLFAGAGANQIYDELCDKMVAAAQQAGRYFHEGNLEKVEGQAEKIKTMYERAVQVDPNELQAHLTYATFLTNANKLEKAENIWNKAKDSLSADILEHNPHLTSYINGKIQKVRYGQVSMLKDSVYSGGSGDMNQTLDLIKQQLDIHPSPQIYYDLATSEVMASSVDMNYVEASISSFRQSQKEAIRGYLSAKELLGVKCNPETSGLREFPMEVQLEGYRPLVHRYDRNAEETRKKMVIQYKPSKGRVALVTNAHIMGQDAVVGQDVCDTWSVSKIAENLKDYYELFAPEKVADAEKVARKYVSKPDKLVDALEEKYGRKNTNWMSQMVASFDKGCSCRVFNPSQQYRVNMAANIPVVDIYGADPEKNQDGSPAFINPPRKPKTLKEAILVSQFAGSSFYHFVIEVIPRITIAVKTHPIDDSVPILIPRDTSKNSFIKKFLSLIPKTQLDPDRLITHDADYKVETLHVPTWLRPDVTGFPESKTTPPGSLLRSTRELLTIHDTPQDYLIYLGRKDTSMRNLSNQAEVIEMLKDYAAQRQMQFHDYSKPMKSVKETRKLFEHARVVVGIHGGAMSNLVFCKPATIVVELGFQTPYAHDYIHMSAAIHFSHTLVLLEPTPLGMGAPTVTVDLPTLEGALEDLLPVKDEL
eukprot:TRINITY_DN34765_c0_g1_i1.p1 TRINITY_DN34765_c0_g1~~TRINITY_DN34765_c0_g1_i1.p1  ORF type:complete len:657 (+),score=145.79 TRINITY_DN34765_c0_g1_i1:69-2039(+)